MTHIVLGYNGERIYCRWLEEAVTESSASEDQEDDTSEEQTTPVGSPHVSDTESDNVSDDDDENVPLSQLAVYEPRNGTKWSKIPPPCKFGIKIIMAVDVKYPSDMNW